MAEAHDEQARAFVRKMRAADSLSAAEVRALHQEVSAFRFTYETRLGQEVLSELLDAATWFKAVAHHAAASTAHEEAAAKAHKEEGLARSLVEQAHRKVEEKERQIAKLTQGAYAAIALLVLVTAAAVAFGVSARGGGNDPSPPAVPPPPPPPVPPRYALIKGELPLLQQCVRLKPPLDDGHLSGGVPMADLAYSIAYHLEHATEQRLRTLCAIHLDLPYCYCAIAHASDNESLLELFNPRLVGYSHSARALVQEMRPGCTRSAWIERFKVVWLRYEDASGATHERRFDGVLAYEAQHILELSEGDTSCGREKAGEQGAIWRLIRDGAHQEPSLRWLTPPPVPRADPKATETPALVASKNE